jgi:hypothetical protein
MAIKGNKITSFKSEDQTIDCLLVFLTTILNDYQQPDFHGFLRPRFLEQQFENNIDVLTSVMQLRQQNEFLMQFQSSINNLFDVIRRFDRFLEELHLNRYRIKLDSFKYAIEWSFVKREITTVINNLNALTIVLSDGTQPTGTQFTPLERAIIKTLGRATLKGEEISKLTKEKAGRTYDYNGTFKDALRNLKNRGILGNKNPGYFLQKKYYCLLTEPSESRDPSRD